MGFGKSSSEAVIGGPLKKVWSKPALAYAVATIFPNSFQLIGEYSVDATTACLVKAIERDLHKESVSSHANVAILRSLSPLFSHQLPYYLPCRRPRMVTL